MSHKTGLLALLLVLLAACSQAPGPEANAAPELAPMFGTTVYDEATGIAKHNRGVYVVGNTKGNLSSTNAGYTDVFIRKYGVAPGVIGRRQLVTPDPDTSSLLWSKQFGTLSIELATGVASDSNNNAYVVGITYGNLAGSTEGGRGHQAFIRKYTSSGAVAWTEQFSSTYPGYPVGSGYVYATGVAVYGNNVYMVGQTYGNLSGTSRGDFDAFIRKYDLHGNVLWTRQFGTPYFDIANDVAVNDSGLIYVVGGTSGSLFGQNGGGSDMFIRAYNPNGSVALTQQHHYSNNDVGKAVAVRGRIFYLVGEFHAEDGSTDVRIIKLEGSGAKRWDISLGRDGTDLVHSASTDGYGNLHVAGSTTSTLAGGFSGGTGDSYVVKVGTNGVYMWAQQFGTSADDRANAVLAHPNSHVYAAGYIGGSRASAEDIYQKGFGDAYLTRLSHTTGLPVWTR